MWKCKNKLKLLKTIDNFVVFSSLKLAVKGIIYLFFLSQKWNWTAIFNSAGTTIWLFQCLLGLLAYDLLAIKAINVNEHIKFSN